jgi:hypothetical protein
MTAVRRLITYVDIADEPSSARQISVALRHELELTDGRQVLLLDDRGWGSTGKWTDRSAEDIGGTSRMVVGPDAPPAGRSVEDMEILHWTSLQEIAQRQGVAVDAAELRQLPHDVVLSERLLARIGTDPSSASPAS